MASPPLDEVDRDILHLLQEDARNLTPVDMASELSVSDGTVRNRIHRMEERGVIERYVPVLDYGEAGFPLEVLFHCTAPVESRAETAEQALDLPHVTNVRETLSAKHNVQVLTYTRDTEGIVHTGQRLVALGLEVEREELLRREHVQPFDGFDGAGQE